MTLGRRRNRSLTSADATSGHRTDDQLLVDGRADPEAFGLFFDRHYEDVLRYFVTRVRSPETAADLSAETLAAALAGLERFDPEKGVARQWLYGIARHQLSRYWRDLRVAREARDRLGITDIPVDDETVRAIARAEARADSSTVFAALDRLPPDQAAAVRLRVVDELEYAEIASLLDCNEGAVRVRVHRGLRRLEVEFG
jgi:RNA polymerase sigma factor (sigma-70 family)